VLPFRVKCVATFVAKSTARRKRSAESSRRNASSSPNLKTAKPFDLTAPPGLLVAADEVSNEQRKPTFGA
jgi:hypothetical protein